MLALRKPNVSDVPAMISLMAPHMRTARLLPRTPRQVLQHLREYQLVEQDGAVVGVGSLSLVDFDLAEVGALAGNSEAVEQLLLDHLLDEARALGVSRAFVLTDDPTPFEACGFRMTTLDALPQKRDRQCLHCPRVATCTQVALERVLADSDCAEAK